VVISQNRIYSMINGGGKESRERAGAIYAFPV